MASDELHSTAPVEATKYHDATPPPLVALFLIKFDLKVGYTIAWKRAIDGVPLEGVVEYKSLPSGLHNVQQDLVYFFHDHYAGVSAFAKGAASAEERNAHFVAVGGMLPLKDGRLGRAWLHAGNLEKLAQRLVSDSANTDVLDEYWEEHGIAEGDAEDYISPQLSPFSVAQRHSRAMSSTTLPSDDRQTLPPFHPALSILDCLDTFGPLIFPLHRIALLRKRILLVTSAPVRKACEFVYDLSVFTSTPLSLATSLVLPSESLARLQPLFAVGIHDIPYLEKARAGSATPPSNGHVHDDDDEEEEEESHSNGWVACTTDEILAMKTKLYDVVVEMPSSHIGHPKGKRRPVIKTADGQVQIKATQRDLRRYNMLRRAMRPANEREGFRWFSREDVEDEERVHLLFRSTSESLGGSESHDDEDDDQLIEPTTWSALAYSSFMWWASAGEKDEHLVEEENHDRALLAGIVEVAEHIADEQRYKDEDADEDTTEGGTQASATADSAGRKDARLEMAIISYFHRVTKKLFDVSADLLDDEEAHRDGSGGGGGAGGDYGQAINVHGEELRPLGLDVWSKTDREFVGEFMGLWYEREVIVDRKGVECCGMRIC